jgi:hypothetical protein
MEITPKRIVVQRQAQIGADLVFIYTDLPSPYGPCVGPKHTLILRFEVGRGRGLEYVQANFDIEPETLDMETGRPFE